MNRGLGEKIIIVEINNKLPELDTDYDINIQYLCTVEAYRYYMYEA